MSVAFLITIPKPINQVNIYNDMNDWLDNNLPSVDFDRRHWTPQGITDPQFRKWELLLPDDGQAVMFKLVFSEYITHQVKIV